MENRREHNKRRRLRDDSNRAIRRWAKRVEKGVELFDSRGLLDALNEIGLVSAFSEQVHQDAPDGFVRKFRHIRNLIAKRPLHGAAVKRNVVIDVLFQLVDSLFSEISLEFMARAKFLSDDRPEMRNSIEAWFFSRIRDLTEPPLGSRAQFRQLFIDRFERFSDNLIRPSLGLTVPECLRLLETLDEMLVGRLREYLALQETVKRDLSAIHERLRDG